MKVEQLMTREVKVCSEWDTLNRAAQLMWEFDCGCIPVTSGNGDGKLVGIVTDRDIAMAAYTKGKPIMAIPVTEVMAHEIIACRASDGISQVEALMRDRKIRRLPVLDQEDHVVGMVSLNDIVREAQREASLGRRAEVTQQGVAETMAFICAPRVSREMGVSSSRAA